MEERLVYAHLTSKNTVAYYTGALDYIFSARAYQDIT